MGENRSLDDFLPHEDDGVANEETASGRSTTTTDGDAGAGPTDTGEADESAGERTAESTGDSREAGEADAGATTGADSAHDGDDAPSPDSPLSTYRWSADGDDCPACGATVDRQWRDGDRFVCADCKDW
jgi:hypothetical protein